MSDGAVDPVMGSAGVGPVASGSISPATPGQGRPSPDTASVPGFNDFDRMELRSGGVLLQAYAQFIVHPQTGEVRVKIIDAVTNEVIRQIPPEEVIKIAEELETYLRARRQARG